MMKPWPEFALTIRASSAGLSRASAPDGAPADGADGCDKPGHDVHSGCQANSDQLKATR
jgi:hypothetical protein